MSDAVNPSFDKNGKYLYFAASTNLALSGAGLDMTSDEHRITRSVYVTVLSKDEKSPLAPESDEEKGKDEAKQTRTRPQITRSDKETKARKDKKAKIKSKHYGGTDKDKDKEPAIKRTNLSSSRSISTVSGSASSRCRFPGRII